MKTRKNNVYYWPNWLEKSFNNNLKSNQLNINIAKEQLKLWKALNIYDDFFDQEGNNILLPLANKYLRTYIGFYYELKLPNSFYLIFKKLFNDLEQANEEEMRYYKFKVKDKKIILKNNPSFSANFLAKKSLVLCLGPLALMIKKHHISPLIQRRIIRFFTYALAAKQLSDDAKDWPEDLKNRHLTKVTYQIINNVIKRNKNIDNKNQQLISFIEIAPKLSTAILSLCQLARNELAKINFHKENLLIKKIIFPLEQSAQKALSFKELLKEV